MEISKKHRMQDQKVEDTNIKMLIRWTVVLLTYVLIINLKYTWRLAFHIIAGFTWYGLVFFLVVVFLPIFGRLSDHNQLEIISVLFPRVFRTASIAGFFAVGIGWYNFWLIYQDQSISYFLSNPVELVFLIIVSLITLLYCFHLIFERKEIETIEQSARTNNYEGIEKIINSMKTIPKVGLTLMSIAILVMFIH